MAYKIINRIIIDNECPTDLVFKQLVGEERLSALFLFEVECLSLRIDMDMETLLGKDMALEIACTEGESRYLHGHIFHVEFSGRDSQTEKYNLYRFFLRPALWYLTMNRDCRIWQGYTLPDIIMSVLAEYHFSVENLLCCSYQPHENCVQYQESAFDFISRLMEHEGIYYYFKHHAAGHVMVLCDAPQAHGPFPGYETIAYEQPGFGVTELGEGIRRWSMSHRITPELCSLDDYDFRKPRAQLLEVCRNKASFAALKTGVFDWPGRYQDNRHGQFLAQIRQQALEAGQQTMSGLATARGMAPGFTFTLLNFPRPAVMAGYLITGMRYRLRDFRFQNGVSSSVSSPEEARAEFVADVEAVPAEVTWRPARVTPWPKTHGPQTAEVTGPRGQSIWTDKYGRVKLRFRWDRHGAGDDTGSCWVRVSSGWAGWKYGSQQVPRVGEEVIVDFINGDPDRPIVTGRVYNEEALPPWELPAHATRMGMMSRSKAGGRDNASYLYLEDSPGQETFAMHAERDMTISVEGDQHNDTDGNLTQRITGRTSSSHHGPCDTLKAGPDRQTFLLGKTGIIAGGGRADIINGGDFRQVQGHSERIVSNTIRQHAGETISQYAGDCLMFEAANKIIYGESLLADQENKGNNALTTCRTGSVPDGQPVPLRLSAVRPGDERQPIHILYVKSKLTAIRGGDKLTVEKDRDIRIKGDASRHIDGKCDEYAKKDFSICSDAAITLCSAGEMRISADSLVHNVQKNIETHSMNSVHVACTAENINQINIAMSQMSMQTDNLVMSTKMVNIANTAMQMETIGINITQGQMDIRTALLNLNTSVLTLFI